MGAATFLAHRLGDIFYLFFWRRRRIARRNLAIAFPELRDKAGIRRIIHGACTSFFLTGMEVVRLRHLYDSPNALEHIAPLVPGLVAKMDASRRLLEETGGFIWVLPHLGNWEVLLHVADLAGIPNLVVVRPLDNPHLEKLLYRVRTDSRQEFVTKHNSFYKLKNGLRRGKCVAIVGDQRAGRRGVMAPFFGTPVSTHRTPALLAHQFNRPLVVLAGCRTPTGWEGLISDPIWPHPEAPEEEEVLRLTTAANEKMADFIRKHPEQYLWAHDRWKQT